MKSKNSNKGLMGMMNGGGANDYPSMMKAQKGGEKAMTYQQIDKLSKDSNSIETIKINGSDTTRTSRPNPYSPKNINSNHQKDLIKLKAKYKKAIESAKHKKKIAKQ